MVRHPVGNSCADSGIIHAALITALPIHWQAQVHVVDSNRLARLVAPRSSFAWILRFVGWDDEISRSARGVFIEPGPVPWQLSLGKIGHCAARRKRAPEDFPFQCCAIAGQRIDDFCFDRILENDPAHSDGGGNYEIDPAGVVRRRLQRAAGYGARRESAFRHVAVATFISESRFAQHRSSLKVGAVCRGVQHRPESAFPVSAGFTESLGASVWVVLNKNIAGHRAFERMADVVDEKVVAVTPPVHVKMLKRVEIVFPQGFVPEEMARIAVVGKPESVLECEKSERLLEDRSPVNFFVETFGELRVSVSRWSRAAVCNGSRRKRTGVSSSKS